MIGGGLVMSYMALNPPKKEEEEEETNHAP